MSNPIRPRIAKKITFWYQIILNANGCAGSGLHYLSRSSNLKHQAAPTRGHRAIDHLTDSLEAESTDLDHRIIVVTILPSLALQQSPDVRSKYPILPNSHKTSRTHAPHSEH